MPQPTNTLLVKNRADMFFGIGLQIISTMFLVRLIVVTGIRILYPFIPQISTGLGLTAIGFSWLIFIRSTIGLTGPLFGVLADRYDRRKIMFAGLLLQSLGMVGVGLSRQWWSVGPIILLGIGATAFLPVQFAYISDLVAYEKRGRVMAAVDVSFAVSGIVILPIAGWLIDSLGWRSPFIILGVSGLIAAAVILFRFPTVDHPSHASLSWSAALGVVFRPNVVASMGAGMLLLFAASTSMTIWGLWLSADFGFTAADLGLVATSIGFAELSGIVLSGLFIDRIGKRRGSQIGLLFTAIAFILLPLTQSSLFMVILILIGLGGAMEFTIISLLSLCSEQVPEARAMMFSLVGLGMAIGMAFGPPVTVALWEKVDLWAVCIASTTSLLLAFMLVWRFLAESASGMPVKA